MAGALVATDGPSVGIRHPGFSVKREGWAHVDLNHGPLPYQGSALTGLSYGPRTSWLAGAVVEDDVRQDNATSLIGRSRNSHSSSAMIEDAPSSS